MIGMKVRYDIGSVNLTISHETPKDADSYVQLTATDEADNEIVFALTHEQAEHLENQLSQASRGRKQHASQSAAKIATGDMLSRNDEDQMAH